MIERKKVLTYSLLAHIHNTGTLISDLIQVFVPIVKRALSKLNSEGVHSGKTISEIQDKIILLYGIDIPLPVLKKILNKIAQEVNTDEKVNFIVYQDNSFSINDYIFTDFDEYLERKVDEIAEVEDLFAKFCDLQNVTRREYSSIFDFIEINKMTLGKYLKHVVKGNGHDYTIEAKFVEFFRHMDKVYDLIRNIYLGSIISSYIEYSPEKLKTEVELIFDTNFIISLLDLNTPESTQTCNKLIEVSAAMGFKRNVLKDTIEETSHLILKKAENFDATFLSKKINAEDIYNACERRGLTKIDLERIADNLESSILNKGIMPIHDTTKYKNIAKYSDEYEQLKKVRYNDVAALHDAIAIHYVRLKRGKKIKEFENVNCWFVNNSSSDNYQSATSADLFKNVQPESIKVDDLLNILWLSNPNINLGINNGELVDIGITTLISCTLSETLPKAGIIKELDTNIQKYAKDKLDDKDIVRVATRITNRKLKNIDQLNVLADTNENEFVKRLETEAHLQKEEDEERLRKMERLISDFVEKNENLDRAREEYTAKETVLRDKIAAEVQKRLDEANGRRARDRKLWEDGRIKKWRSKSIRELVITIAIFLAAALYLGYISGWSYFVILGKLTRFQNDILLSSIFGVFASLYSLVVIANLVSKYRNQSNIKAFRDMLVHELPDDLKELKELPE